METRSNHRVRFKSFELDLSARELRRNGLKVRLQGHPVEVLAMLLERPGEVVTREEIQRRLWPEDTFVDFEHGLNSTVRRLRDALGDSADNPRFIETLPRLGYRFIAPLEAANGFERLATTPNGKGGASPAPDEQTGDFRTVSSETSREPVSQAVVTNAPAIDTILEPVQPPAQLLEGKSKKRDKAVFVWLAVPVCIAVGIAAGWYLLRPPSEPRITAHRQITHDGRPKQLIGTDGNRLYFNQDLGTIWQVSVSGGESAQIPVPLDHVTALVDTSRDGSNLLIVTHHKGFHPDGQLWVVPIFGGAIHSLPDGLRGAISPDGKFVAYAKVADGGIWVVRSDGTGARHLASLDLASTGRPRGTVAWSPDGSKVRVFSGDGRLWEVSVDGSNAHVVQARWPPFAFRCCGRWTPDGKFFLFLNGTTRGYYPQPEIWALDERHHLLRPASSDPIQLTSGPMEWGQPTPSPDGKTVYADASMTRGELSRIDVKSGRSQPYLGGISAQGISFSPDAKSVAYVSLPEGALWKADRDGSNPVQLSEPGMDVGLPRWSPDSTQILFYEFYGGLGHMYVISANGGAPRRVIPQDPFPENDPGWSPDGQKIVFASPSERKPGDDPYLGGWVLRILDLKNHQVTNVPGSSDSYSARWSPDGRYIAALSRNTLGLKIFDTRTQHWSVINAQEDFAFPEWSSDSHWIYFSRPFAPPTVGPTGIFRVRPTGGEPERVVDLTPFHVIGWFNTWFTLDPTGAPLIVKDAGTHDLYGLTLELK